MNKDKLMAVTKTCSECGYQIDNLDLSIREWVCSDCDSVHDRDINASINILKRGESELTLILKNQLSKGIDLT